MIGLVGGTGRIGRHVAQALPGARVLCRPRWDLRDPATLDLTGIERLFLLTPHGPDQDLLERAAIDAAVEAGVRRIVKVSGGAASLGPNGATATGVAHWRSERRIEQAGLEFAFLRPSFLLQNLPAMAVPWAGVLALPMGHAPIAMVDARDVAACAVALLTTDDPTAGAWSVTGSQAVTFGDVARRQGARYLAVRPALAAKALRRRGASAWEVDHALRMAAYFAAGCDSAVTRTVLELTGRPPRGLDAFLSDKDS